MSDRWEERKEQLATFRTEYGLLFPDLHFFQGLRFAVLGATLPITAGLFTFYRTALPFVSEIRFMPGQSTSNEPYTALFMALLAVVLFAGVYSVDLGIRNQTTALITRGAKLEEMLSIENGAFATLKNRVRIRPIFRISGIITAGFYLGLAVSVYMFMRALVSAIIL